jgi:hypothetical protein
MASLWLPGAKVLTALKDSGALSGNVKKVVWHTTENDPTKTTAYNVAAYLNRVSAQVHLVWNPTTGEIVQMIPANRGARALKNAPGGVDTNTSGGIVIQIEVVGRAAEPFTNGPCKGLPAIVAWLRSLGIPDVWPAGDLKAYPASYGGTRSTSAWSRSGHFGHSQVPENDHGDPGDIDQSKITGLPKPAPTPTPTPVVPKPVVLKPETTKIIALQRVLHVGADGMFGPGTYRAASAVITRNLRDVRYLQRIVGTIADGIWGPNSEAARKRTIAAIQRIIGTYPDGIWGPKSSAAWSAFLKRNYMKY